MQGLCRHAHLAPYYVHKPESLRSMFGVYDATAMLYQLGTVILAILEAPTVTSSWSQASSLKTGSASDLRVYR